MGYSCSLCTAYRAQVGSGVQLHREPPRGMLHLFKFKLLALTEELETLSL